MFTGAKRRMRLALPGRRRRTEEELRRNRTTAIVVLAIMLAIMALTIWLANFGGGQVLDGIDYWPMIQ